MQHEVSGGIGKKNKFSSATSVPPCWTVFASWLSPAARRSVNSGGIYEMASSRKIPPG